MSSLIRTLRGKLRGIPDDAPPEQAMKMVGTGRSKAALSPFLCKAITDFEQVWQQRHKG